MNRKLKTIDLFAGIGGIRLGFEQFFALWVHRGTLIKAE